MKSKTRLIKSTILTMIFLFMMSISVVAFAAGKYTDDQAGVLNSTTIDSINTNFAKVEQNSGAVVKMVTVKSIGKQNTDAAADAAAQDYAKQNFSTNKYVLFFVAPNDGKTRMLVGSGLNAVFSKSDIESISHLSDSNFKKKDFSGGFSTVGQAIDKKITSAAVKTGDAKVSSNGYSTSVKPATPWGKYFVIFLIIVILIVLFVLWFKRKADQEQEKKKKQFINNNYDSLHDLDNSSASFKSASVDSGLGSTTTTTYTTSEPQYKSYTDPIYDNDSYVVHETHQTVNTPPTHRTSSGTSHTTVNNTTIVNNNNNRRSGYGYGGDGFVEGMIVNEMLHDHDHHHHHDDYNNDYHHDNYETRRSEPEVTSGDWNNSGASDWSPSYNDNSNDSGSSDWSSPSDDSSNYSDDSSNYNDDSGSSDW